MNPLDRLLNELEAALVTHGLYTPQRPAPEAFNSTQPFFYDTMSFPCWLQYVFIEKMRLVIQAQGPLPKPCNIAEMGQMYGVQAHFPSELVAVLQQIDDCINRS